MGTAPAGTGAATGPAAPVARTLAAVYAIFALAAGARSTVQLATKFHTAPLAYVLSGIAALLYLVATVALRVDRRDVVLGVCSVELLGVIIVGTLSLIDSRAFPDQTVWSGYGSGYGCLPLVLPVAGLAYLRRTRAG